MIVTIIMMIITVAILVIVINTYKILPSTAKGPGSASSPLDSPLIPWWLLPPACPRGSREGKFLSSGREKIECFRCRQYATPSNSGTCVTKAGTASVIERIHAKLEPNIAEDTRMTYCHTAAISLQYISSTHQLSGHEQGLAQGTHAPHSDSWRDQVARVCASHPSPAPGVDQVGRSLKIFGLVLASPACRLPINTSSAAKESASPKCPGLRHNEKTTENFPA